MSLLINDGRCPATVVDLSSSFGGNVTVDGINVGC